MVRWVSLWLPLAQMRALAQQETESDAMLQLQWTLAQSDVRAMVDQLYRALERHAQAERHAVAERQTLEDTLKRLREQQIQEQERLCSDKQMLVVENKRLRQQLMELQSEQVCLMSVVRVLEILFLAESTFT